MRVMEYYFRRVSENIRVLKWYWPVFVLCVVFIFTHYKVQNPSNYQHDESFHIIHFYTQHSYTKFSNSQLMKTTIMSKTKIHLCFKCDLLY